MPNHDSGDIPSLGGLSALDLSAARERHGLTSIPHIKVTASELANLGFCEAFVVLSGLYPDAGVTPAVAQRRAEGMRAHSERADQLQSLKAAGKLAGLDAARR